MEGRSTLFIVGDSQVGKTTIARHLYPSLTLVSSGEEATEYQVLIRGREFPLKIMEIRSCNFFAENKIEFNLERDVIFLCFAVNNLDSFKHVVNQWIPLFKQLVGDALCMVLIGHKNDLADDSEVMRTLVERGLEPVSADEGIDLAVLDDTVDFFVESSINDYQKLDQVFPIIRDDVLNYN